jgi:hypothetical protein
MKKNSLTTALLAGLAGAAGLATTAHAVNLNPDGLGQTLIYPYYTVNSGNQTALSVVNTANNVKAVKVRFLESRNSREVLDFNLYLSAFDVWTASVFAPAAGANTAAGLVTLDNSCTVPQIRGNTSLPLAGANRFVPFRNFAYTGDNDDAGGEGEDRTREGHFEMIEMGVLLPGSAAGFLAEEATHNAAGVPANCGALTAAWLPGGIWNGISTASNFTNTPTGGLFGAAGVVDVANGTMLAYNAEAIDGFYSTGNPADDLHTNPGDLNPSLNNARTGSPVPPVTSYVFSSGPTSTVVTSSWASGVDAVSAVFMVNALYNEYTTQAGLGAATEWTVTFPTKNFYVDSQIFGGRATLAAFNSSLFEANPPFAGFGFTSRNGAIGGLACESVSLAIFDREEQRPGGGSIDFSPLPPGVPGNALCEETNVISFNQDGTESDILGSRRPLNINSPFADGWLQMGFPANEATNEIPGFISLDGDTYFGLPATGYEAVNVINANVSGGVLANYAGFFKHRGSRAITASGG